MRQKWRTAERSCCGQSGSHVLEFGFQQDFIVYTYTVEHHVHSVQNCAKLNLRRAFRNASTSSGMNPSYLVHTTAVLPISSGFRGFPLSLGGTWSIHMPSSYNDKIPPNSHLLRHRLVVSHVATSNLCTKTTSLNEISGFHRAVVKIFALLGCCAVSVRYRLFGTLYRSHIQGSWPLKIGLNVGYKRRYTAQQRGSAKISALFNVTIH